MSRSTNKTAPNFESRGASEPAWRNAVLVARKKIRAKPSSASGRCFRNQARSPGPLPQPPIPTSRPRISATEWSMKTSGRNGNTTATPMVISPLRLSGMKRISATTS